MYTIEIAIGEMVSELFQLIPFFNINFLVKLKLNNSLVNVPKQLKWGRKLFKGS